ncbi:MULTISPECIES: IclR family transcriptional regulator [unclassified Roseitalea]|uniref:IclR family transcriptional regulator n=1 Tax=unclassified Roseitalea TaxID=2639107 RepID=UPI00273D4C39|nr:MULTISPECIES: IclR family transcriptional regulator [unclassified Roseitalea]
MPQSQKKYAAPALEKGLDILELLSTEEQGLGLSEISRSLGRSVSEIFRMLVVLTERGYVAQDPDTDRYVLTTLLFEVAHRTPLIKRLTALAGPQMRRLSRQVNQTIHLAVISNDAVLVVGQVDAPGNNILSVRLGARIDLWRASSGRVMLAFMPQEDLAEVFSQVPLPEGKTEPVLREELAKIRKRGHEITESFVLRGIINISAPIIDHTGQAIAALTIPHLERYHDTVSFDECCTALFATAEQLSRSIGGGVSTPQGDRPAAVSRA